MIIKRTLLEELKSHLAQKEISLIIGPRQAGKTTLMLLLKDFLDKEGKKTLFLNLDVEADRRFFQDQESLLKKIQLEVGDQKAYVFIDEIQRKENAGLFLKGIYDLNLPYKLIISGSGSLELKEKVHESLSGRKRIFELGTLTFAEFVNFKTDYQYENRLDDFFAVEKTKTRSLLEEYLNFGGYPRVVQIATLSEKRKIIEEIYKSYLEKDISLLLGVKRSDEFSNLVKILASQIGQLINYSELASSLGISLPTVKEYLWYLEQTFIIKKVTPFFRNLRKEIIKNPIFYFNDLGLRNYSLGVFGNLRLPQELGFVFQNYIFNLLRENLQDTAASLHFWRTKSGAEVDFVIDYGRAIIPIEAKFKEIKEGLKKKEITRSFRSFLAQYQPPKGYVVNLHLDADLRFKQTIINFIPFFKLLGMKF